MAFLVCYSIAPPSDHAKDTAVHLDQGFYRSIFRSCRREDSGYSVLRDIALLRYKSPTLTVPKDRLTLLIGELVQLETSNDNHPQINKFRSVRENAIARECALTISGDMYPELPDDPV